LTYGSNGDYAGWDRFGRPRKDGKKQNAPLLPFIEGALMRLRGWHVEVVLLYVALQCLNTLTGCAEKPSEPMAQAPERAPETWPTDPSRLRLIERALREKNGVVFRRAIQESAAYVANDPALAKLVLDSTYAQVHYTERASYTGAFAVAALGNARGESAQVVVQSYKDADPIKRGFLRTVFGRIGVEAGTAAPTLREELSNPQISAKGSIAIKVVLASIGQASESELGEIATAISGREPLGTHALWEMVDIGRNEWVNEAVKRAIIKVLDDFRRYPHQYEGSDAPGLAAAVLGTLGSRADNAVRVALARCVGWRRGPEDRLGWYTEPVLSLAKVDAGGRKKLLSTEPYFGGQSGEFLRILEMQCAGIRDPQLIDDVASLLGSESPAVVAQAANILCVIGPDARGATPSLLRVARDASEKDVRLAAAIALGMVAPPSTLPEIKAVLHDARGQVKDAIEQSILAINLGEP